MNMTEIRVIARQRNVSPGKLSKPELIRAIQAGEGNFACFDTDSSMTCGQDQCLWRSDCDRV